MGKIGLEAVSKMPLKDHTADASQLKVMESAMNCREFVIANLESAGLADPAQGSLDDVADLAQAAAVGRARLGQMVLDVPLAKSLMVARRAIGAIAVEVTRSAAWSS